MIAKSNNEYKKLSLDSSNLIMLADSRITLGRYEESAYHFRQAGEMRQLMGQLEFRARHYEWACEDWLSSAACFLAGTAPESATAVFEKTIPQMEKGRVSAERGDVHAAFAEREKEITAQKRRIQRFNRTFDAKGNLKKKNGADSLDALLGHRKKLPGYWRLHWAISCQAFERNQEKLAAEHFAWAIKFDPDNPNLKAVEGLMHIAKGESQEALELGNEFLDKHPDASGAVRWMNAFALLNGRSTN